MRLFDAKPSISEITQYTKDLQTMTQLRDKCHDKDERNRYDNIIECMQLVLIKLNGGKNR